MKAQILLVLCLTCCHAYRNADYDEYEGNGYKPRYNGQPSDGYYKESEGYGEYEKPSYGGEYEREGYGEYEKEGYGEGYGYEKEGYGSKDYNGDEGYYAPSNYGYPRDDYYGDGDVDCTNPHKWPLDWQTKYLCVNPYSGVRQVFNATTCKVTASSACFKWPGTSKSCTFMYSGPDKCCSEKKGVCDVAEYCTGSGMGANPECPADQFLPSTTVCRYARGPCENDAKCPGNSAPSGVNRAVCPTAWKATGAATPVVCNTTKAPPCDVEDICKVGDFNCPPRFAEPTVTCGPVPDAEKFPCDLQNTCSGKDNTCVDRVVPKSAKLICNPAARLPCIRGGKCDGTFKTCPAITHAPIGTPCRKDMPNDLEEAYDAITGMVAVKGDYSKDHVQQHGWVECDRCYGAECQSFKWEYWNTADGGHYSTSHKSSSYGSGSHKSSTSHKSSSGHKSGSHSSGSHSKSGHKTEAGAYAVTEAEPTEEFYPTGIFEYLDAKASTASDNQATIQNDYGSSGHKVGKGSYVPDVYCHNPYKF